MGTEWVNIPSHRSDLPSRSEAEQKAFFDEALELARRAEANCGQVLRTIEISGIRICLIFAGATLERLMLPALAHRLKPTTDAADVIIHVWDSASTGVQMCPPPVEQYCFSERGDIWTFHSTRIRSAYHWSEYSLNLLDLDQGEGVYWLQTPEYLPYWAQASPFRTLLHWCMEDRGFQLVHASAVGTEAGGVLITGKGGIGKSTTALACLAAGFEYVGDDYVVLEGGGEVRAHSLYRTAKVNPADAASFERFSPRMLGGGAPAGGEKAVMFLDDVFCEGLALKAVLTPRFGEQERTLIEPVERSILIGAATFSTMAQLPHAGQKTADFIEAQIARLPVFRLVLGRDIAKIPDAIRRLLDAPDRSQPELPIASSSPLVSVIIPVYNASHFLADAVRSVLAQNFGKLEIIVVDDGSIDSIAEAVDALPVQVRFLQAANNGGPAAARNHGIRAASADFIAFLDVDDLWPPHKLEASIEWLRNNPETDVVLGSAQLMEHNASGPDEFRGSPAENFTYYIGAGLYRRRAFEKNGLFDPLLRFGEDLDWFARVEENSVRIDRIDIVTLRVRRHTANSTRGLNHIELTPLKILKNAVDRKRSRNQSCPE